jgi:hypothetical protein
MVIASFAVACVALLIAFASAAYTRTQAVAATGALAIEKARHLEERRPRFSGEIYEVGTMLPPEERSPALRITLETDERLAAVKVRILYGQGVAFQVIHDGHRNQGVVPDESGDALSAFVYDYTGAPSGMRPHQSKTWVLEIQPEHADVLRLEATCHGMAGEQWDSVLITAPVPPPRQI